MARHVVTVTDNSVVQDVGTGIAIGNAFAFLPAELLDRPSLRWVRSLVPLAARRPRVVSLLDTAELPGVVLTAAARLRLSTAVVTSDKALYREGTDTVNVLVCDPLGGGREVQLEIQLSGRPFATRPVTLSARGAAAVVLRDLPVGDYKLRLRDALPAEPTCDFTVATYKLSPLVAQLDSQQVEANGVTLRVTLTSFGVPVNGTVQIEVLDAGTRISRGDVVATNGALVATVGLFGKGPHSVNLQLAADPSRTATLPLVGSRESERTDTTFSTLGHEVTGTVLASADADPVRGIYLRRGGVSTSPVRLDRVATRRPVLTAMVDLDPMVVCVVDPTIAAAPNAVDPTTAAHPAHEDELYRRGEELFLAGDFASALETLAGARARIARPHPNYAYFIACAHARLGQTAQAIAMLRAAVRDGWNDYAHLRADSDLASIRDEADYELIANRGVRTIETALKRGETLELDVPAPLAYLAIGAFIGNASWEGAAAIVAPPTEAVAIDAPAKAAPRDKVSIGVRGRGDVYLIVKDARLLTADTPASRLAGQIKTHVAETRPQLAAPTTQTLASLIPPPSLGGMNHCNRCGKDNQQHYKFCLGCGAEIFTPPGGAGGLELGITRTGALMLGGPPTGMPVTRAPGGMPPPSPSYSQPPLPGMAAPQGIAPPPAMMRTMMPAAAPMMQVRSAPSPDVPLPSRAPEPAAPARVIHETPPEVVFAGLVQPREGVATVEVELGAAIADYVVEAFAIDGVEWSAATARFRAEAATFAEFSLPAFVRAGDVAIGRLAFAGAAPITLEVRCDDRVVASDTRNERGELELTITGPGDYTATLTAGDGATARAFARVDEPGKLRRIARTIRLLAPRARIAKADDPSYVSLRAIPGLATPLAALCDATADYGHACCEQTAAKMLAAATGYMFAGDDGRKRARYEDIVIAGVRRERTMFLPSRGFKMYPDSRPETNDHWGKLTAQYLWNLELVRGMASKALVEAIDDALDMARDSTAAYRIAWPPRDARTAGDAYRVVRFNPDAREQASAMASLQHFAQTPQHPRQGRVAFRADSAYAAAGLFRAGGPAQFPTALALANQVASALGPDARLYSTVDSVAAIAMLAEVHAAGLVNGAGAPAVSRAEEIVAGDRPVAVEVTRITEDDWDAYGATVPVTITLSARGRSVARVSAGEGLELKVRLDAGYTPGDLVWIALPDALSRVIGGGQVKRFSVDFAGTTEVTIPLAATAVTPRGPQHFSVCVRNMFEEERVGNPGPLDIEVTP